MGVWAVVPVKELDRAKERLAPVLPPEQRRALMLAMLEDVLTALAATTGLSGLAVVTVDAAACRLAARYGARIIETGARDGHSGAVAAAARLLAAEECPGMLTLPGDIPLVTPAEIAQLLAPHRRAPSLWRGQLLPAFAGGRGMRHPPDRAAPAGHCARCRYAGGSGFFNACAGGDPGACTARPAARRGSYRRPLGMTTDEIVSRVEAGRRLSAAEALALADHSDLQSLMGVAAALRDEAHGDLVSYSRKVFIPLTQLCRDVCHYCTFAHPPRPGEPAYLGAEQVLEIARAGARAGCHEALFTLGDKPELRYGAARDALQRLGHETTLSYLAEMAGLVLRGTGPLPPPKPRGMTPPQ